MNNIEAATSYGALTLLIKPFLQEPKYLKEADVIAIASHLESVLDFLETITPEDVSHPRALVFGKGGNIQLNVQVVEGEIQMAIKDSQDRLLLALALPREVSLKLATSILSHQTPEAPPNMPQSQAN